MWASVISSFRRCGAAPAGNGSSPGAVPFTAATLNSVKSQLLTSNTIPVRFKNFLNATISNPINDQAPAWYFAMAYACDPTTYSSYGDFVTAVGGSYFSGYAGGSPETGHGNPSDSPGLVGSIDSYIDAQNTLTSAYSGSGALPQWCSDNFYNTRNMYVDLAFVYACCKDKMSSTLKQKVVDFLDRGLLQANSSTPLCNGHSINPSYAWKEAGGGPQPYDNYMYGHMKAFSSAYYCLGSDSANQATYYDVFRNQMWETWVKPALNSLDGAGKEGTGYGAAEFELYWCLEMWYQATGEDLFAAIPNFWANKLSSWAHFVTPDLAYLMNYGDHARVSISGMYDYNRMLCLPIMTHFPTATETKAMKALLSGATAPEDGGPSLATTNHALNCGWDVLYPDSGITAGSVSDFGNYRRDNAAGYVDFRTGWTSADTAVFMSFGRKDQDHDHADKGAFTIYNKSWIAYDQNINSQSGEIFDSDVVNYVAILNGSTLVGQSTGSGTKPTVLFAEDGSIGYFYHSVDFSAIWSSPVTGYKREVVFFPKSTGGVLVIYDHIVSSSARNKRWQMNTPYVPSLSTTAFSNDTATIAANGSVTAKVQLIESGSTGFTVSSSWVAGADITQNYTGGALTSGRRLDCQRSTNTADFLTVIDIGGKLTSAVSPGNTGTLHKVNLTFADTTTKNLSFDELANHVTVA